MRRIVTACTAILILWMSQNLDAAAQESGDYRSAAQGDWSNAATWERYDGSAWAAALTAPDGSEHIAIMGEDTVTVDIAVQVTGYLIAGEQGHLTVGSGSMTFADGSTYEHARDAGSVPVATWEEGSTFLLTGTVQDAPGNRNQDFHHVTFNTPELGRNRDMGWNEVVIGGDVRVVSTGSNRWQLTSASGGESASFEIRGDVVLEDGAFAVQGTSNALTTFTVHHYGDVIVTGGNFSLARGSQGNGSGSTTWYMHEGDFSLSDATTQNSNPEPGQAKVVFAADGTQQLSFSNVNHAGGQFNLEVAETATLEVADGFEANGLVVNHGVIEPLGELTFSAGSVYDHARNGGSVPTATWDEGSTARLSGITSDAPGNRGQDYFDLVLDTPDLASNRDLSLDGSTIHGTLHVVTTGSARWQMVGGSSGTVTIMGDVIMEDGTFAVQGTSSPTDVVVDHYGDIVVTGGNFSIARGGQGGTGTTRWYLHEGDFSMSDATTQNSNSSGASFVFAGEETQALHLSDVSYGGGSLPITVAAGATLDITGAPIEGNAAFVVEDEGVLMVSHADGIDGVVQTSGDVTFARSGGLRFAGTEAQVPGTLLPDSVGVLAMVNPAGVTVSDTIWADQLYLEDGAALVIDTTGAVHSDSGTINGSIVNSGELSAQSQLTFTDGSTYEHARDGGSIPTGEWQEGATVILTGTEGSAPDNRNQSFHHLVFNTPDQASNLHMSFDEITIGGDIQVISTGAARWYLTSASAGDSTSLTIMGDIVMEEGQFAVHGTGNALTSFTVDHHGDIIVTGGNFSIARGSQGNGSGSTTWNLHGGDFRMSGATSQNSNKDGATFVFRGDEVQHLELDAETDIANLPFEVAEGATVDFGLSELAGADRFVLADGAFLATAHPDGINGAVQTTGDVSLGEASGFIFNGSDPQETGTLMPIIVQDLAIDNETGVTLSQETTINGVLRLISGVFNNSVPFELGEDGTISEEGGSLLVEVSSEMQTQLPAEFRMHQNYPNPFNGSTTIQYELREQVQVSIVVYDVLGRRVAELVNQQQDAGSYRVQWDAADLASGMYVYRINAGEFSDVRTLTLMK